MRPTLLASTLRGLIDVQRGCIIEGSPGLGKTQIVQQVCRDMSIGFIHKHAPTMQPEDLGLPVPNTTKTKINFIVPESFPTLDSDYPEVGAMLLDELPAADNSVQKTLANLIQEREIHGHKIKPGWTFIATGNRQSDRAGANRILGHLANRMTRLPYDPDLDDWCNWALVNGVDPTVISFLRFKPGLLSDYDPQRDSNPTPRAWVEGVSQIIGHVPSEAELACFCGAVGEGAASEFVGFLRIARSLPDPDKVLREPLKADVPKDPSTLYALSGAISHRATSENFGNVLAYAERMPPEFLVLTVQSAIKREPSLTNTKAFATAVSGPLADILFPSK